MVKLVLAWDIQQGKAEEYVEFALGELAPSLEQLGLTLSDAWFTWVGAGPQIIVAGWMPSAADAQRLLASDAFLELKDRLLQYATDITWRITTPNPGELPF